MQCHSEVLGGESTELSKFLNGMIDGVLDYVHLIEKSHGKTESSVLDEMDHVVLTEVLASSPSVGLDIESRRAFGGRDCFNQQDEGWLLGKAITTGLTVYVQQKLERNPRYSKEVYGEPPLHHAIRATPISLDMVRLLLQHGASPNQKRTGITPWDQLLLDLSRVQAKHSVGANGDWAELIDAMIGAGAKPDPKPFDKDATTAIIKMVSTPSDAARFITLLEQRHTSKRSGRVGVSKLLRQLKGTSAQIA